jgi:UDP-3-O-[3-hydroxymyristoyl] glucosamine N-acyltransferase
MKISQILEYLKNDGYETEYAGDADLNVKGFCALSDLKQNSVTWIKDLKKFNINEIDESLNLLIVTNEKYSGDKKLNVISHFSPKSIFFSILNEFFIEKQKCYIAPDSTVLTERVGENVSIGHNCFIGDDVKIGKGTVIKHNVVIESPTEIGEDCVIESGTVICGAGCGYYRDARGLQRKVPDFGGVKIGNRVEIGANCCVDRGTLGDTTIADDVKIDNLCHIGHNVQIAENCCVTAMTMFAGSAVIEKEVYIAPGALIMNQITVGERSFVGIGAVATKNVEKNKVVVGVPAKVLRDNFA